MYNSSIYLIWNMNSLNFIILECILISYCNIFKVTKLKKGIRKIWSINQSTAENIEWNLCLME